MRLLTAAVLLLLSTSLVANEKQKAIESNLATAVAIRGVQGKSLEQRMRETGVPAISFAVVEDGKVVLAAAYGYADLATKRPATTATLFQAASISKPLTAMAVMDLVERGRISLDAPVNTLLRNWKLPENELTAKTPVSLRLLLSHSAGTTVHGFPGYAPDEPHPTLTQILEGKAPANTAPIVVDLAPNTKFRYSGGGTTLAQAVLVDQFHTPFPTFMRRTLLQPLGMTRSTYEQPLPKSRRNEAATAYRIGLQEVEGKWHVYPEMAAAGLWTTPSDLAQVIIEIQNALAGRPTKVLTIDGARHVVTPRFQVARGVSMGIGFAIRERGDARYFDHGGSNEGFRAFVQGTLDGQKGAVVMTNSDSGATLAEEVLQTIAREYGFPGYSTTPLEITPIVNARDYPGRYALESKQVISIRSGEEGLEVLDLTTGWQRLYPVTGGTLARTDRNVLYAIAGDRLSVIGKETEIATRLPDNAPLTGDELLSAGRIDEALAAYREELKADPASMPEAALNNAGYSFLYGGRLPQAIALLQLNTELYPTSANTYDGLAEALIAAGETERAIAVLEELLRRVDDDPKAAGNTKSLLRSLAESRLKSLRKQ